MKKATRLLTLLVLVSVAAIAIPPTHATSNFPYFTFTAAGDIGADVSGNLNALVNSVNGSSANFFLTLGDLSYAEGGITEAQWCSRWVTGTPQGKFYKNVIVTTGNHESGESTGGLMNNFVTSCGVNNNFGGLGSNWHSGWDRVANGTVASGQKAGCVWGDSTRKCFGKEFYFDFPSSNPVARFIITSPNIIWSTDPFEPTNLQWTYDNCASSSTHCGWVISQIDSARSSGIKWIIVVMHKNYIETANGIGALVGSEFFNKLVEKKVDLILQGHAHDYERSEQLALNPTTCPSIPTTFDGDCVVATGNSFYEQGGVTAADGTLLDIVGTGGRSDFDAIRSLDLGFQYFQTGALNDTTNGYIKATMNKLRMDITFVKTAGSGTFTETYTIRAKDDAAFEWDWSDINNDGIVSILDTADISFHYNEACVNWTQTQKACYYDENLSGIVDTNDVNLNAYYFDTRQSSPYFAGSANYKIDEFWRTRCDGLNARNKAWCNFYFANN